LETITAAVWYPAAEESLPYTYEVSEDFRSEVALDSPVDASGAPYPLVFFAHGGYGCGYDSAFFTEYLAARGYVVVAPDFVDTRAPLYREQIAFGRIGEGNTGSVREVLAIARQFTEDMEDDSESFLSYLAEHRLGHVSFVLDEILAENAEPSSFLYGAIDEKALGMCGHSLGGTTTLGKTGAHPDTVYQDERFKAALLFSAPPYPFEQSLQDIAVPVMLMVGDDDPAFMHPELPRHLIFTNATAPKYLAVVEDANHFSFSNRVCGSTSLHLAAESNGKANAICRYGHDFFEAYLLDSSSALAGLHEPDPAFVYYAWEESPGELHQWGEEPAGGGEASRDMFE
jgi:predicted dienelactone hydrolase